MIRRLYYVRHTGQNNLTWHLHLAPHRHPYYFSIVFIRVFGTTGYDTLRVFPHTRHTVEPLAVICVILMIFHALKYRVENVTRVADEHCWLKCNTTRKDGFITSGEGLNS